MPSQPDRHGGAFSPSLEILLDRLSRRFDARDRRALATGEKALLRRLDPNAPARAMPVLVPLLLDAGLKEERLRSLEHLCRWALVVHAMAILAGTAGGAPHAPADENTDDSRRRERDFGRALARTGFAEARLMRLTSARGGALSGLVARAARFLAGKTGPLDLRPLARLVLHEGLDERHTDKARLAIARGYYAASADEQLEHQNVREIIET